MVSEFPREGNIVRQPHSHHRDHYNAHLCVEDRERVVGFIVRIVVQRTEDRAHQKRGRELGRQADRVSRLDEDCTQK